jgi:hypothetical protein
MTDTEEQTWGEWLARTVDGTVEIYATENDEAWIRSSESVPISWQS